jgi:hypothetical protein
MRNFGTSTAGFSCRAPAARRASGAERERAQAGRSRRRVPGRQARLEDEKKVITDSKRLLYFKLQDMARQDTCKVRSASAHTDGAHGRTSCQIRHKPIHEPHREKG